MGRGMKGQSVTEHGPQLDNAKFPDAAFVRVKVFVADLGKPATVTRKLKVPTNVTSEPPDAGWASLPRSRRWPPIPKSRLCGVRSCGSSWSNRRSVPRKSRPSSSPMTSGNRAAAGRAQHRPEQAAIRAERRDGARSSQQGRAANPSTDSGSEHRAPLGLPEIAELPSDPKLENGQTSSATGQEFNEQSAAQRDLNAASAAFSGLAAPKRRRWRRQSSEVASRSGFADCRAAPVLRWGGPRARGRTGMLAVPSCQGERSVLRAHLTEKLAK